MKCGIRWIIGFLLLVGLAAAVGARKQPNDRESLSTSPAPAALEVPPAETESRPVVRGEHTFPPSGETVVRQVIDGDTIVLESGQIVRYIGVDAPETGRPRSFECFSAEATARNRELVEGKPVRLEKDISETDKYGRMLRYVHVGDVLVNEALVRDGYATARSYPPDVRYRDLFRSAEAEAREAKRGLWGDACSAEEPARSSTTSRTHTSQASAPPNDRDCPDFQNRTEAQAFFESQGGPAEDPHRLDQDRDGLACESLP